MPQFPTIPSLPIAPSRLDEPAVFVPRADAFLGALSAWGLLLNDWAAALPSQITGTDYTGSSVTSMTIGTGSKTFTSSAGRFWQIGQGVRIAYTTTPSNFMDGQITAYNSVTGSTTVNVTSVGGAGTQANWTLSLLPGTGSFVTLAGVETLTNKTLISPTIATIINGAATITLPTVTGTLATLANAETFTNKTIALGNNTVSGTIAQFNAALTDGDFATIAGAETFTNKTLTAPTINGGTLRGDVAVSDGGTIAETSVGFRGIPLSANGTNTLVLSDNGKAIHTASNQTIPANSAVAFPIGASIMIVNTGGSTLTIGITTDTLRWSGTASTGTRTLAGYGQCVLRKVGSTEWRIAGDVT